MEALLGDLFFASLRNGDGSPFADKEVLKGKELLLLLFSGQFCASCRTFKNKLMQWYGDHHSTESAWDVVFVSDDEERQDFNDFSEELPFASVAFEEEDLRKRLSDTYHVNVLPTLLVVDRKGKVVERNGYTAVLQNQAEFPIIQE